MALGNTAKCFEIFTLLLRHSSWKYIFSGVYIYELSIVDERPIIFPNACQPNHNFDGLYFNVKHKLSDSWNHHSFHASSPILPPYIGQLRLALVKIRCYDFDKWSSRKFWRRVKISKSRFVHLKLTDLAQSGLNWKY